MTYYPVLPDLAAFNIDIVLKNMAEDPEFLAESPYTAEECEIIVRIAGLAPVSDDITLTFDPDDDIWSNLESQTKQLYTDLMAERTHLSSKDNTEKMSFFRTATSLLEKLISIQERSVNIRKIHQFHNTVLTVMDDICDAGQRTEVMERLERAISE
jgi:hypothetical protein